ncbi:adenylate kinase family enzyme [Cytobacillus horneckiae]|uniref:Tunicamycin resistance protein n=1 Tax=Cytobacillus horneckiae TaxID=549687 RepID=A0A2N0ZLK8_9BACI|nr:hypothetical protein [Cytobacillus horneckiae]MBN6885835.1 tunicamycin resistance protein [Cytobacillus horneckiae]MCM3177381.1 tunicamycin resistance protein [Cytobacillus horneckiae]MEC1156055.1 tunicamycin resistance protein [Cytobacillus horneckiae]MED2937415.1 tunicamycin resistance protein [Cytobacillus horneckiae]PKG30401.1 tunicamycin resistance protein [Cytobacillus horneckiae]
MILWINGTFGSGKTTLSYELNDRIEGSFRYDPEKLGSHLMRTIPANVAENDFQKYQAWRTMVCSMILELSMRLQGKIIIVPMTLTNKDYRHEIFSALKSNGLEVHEVLLEIKEDKLLKLLQSRMETKSSWAYKQFEYKKNEIKQIDTFKLDVNERSIDDVAETVISHFNLPARADQRGILQKKCKRMINKFRESFYFK